MLRSLAIFLYLFTLFFIAELAAEALDKTNRDTQSFSIPYYQQSIILDGQLDEAIWQKAQHFPLNYANNRKGEKVKLLPTIQWDINDAVNIRVEHTFEKMKVLNDELYTANLTDLRVNYQFNSDSKVRLSLIHNKVIFNPSNYTFDIDKKSKSLGCEIKQLI